MNQKKADNAVGQFDTCESWWEAGVVYVLNIKICDDSHSYPGTLDQMHWFVPSLDCVAVWCGGLYCTLVGVHTFRPWCLLAASQTDQNTKQTDHFSTRRVLSGMYRLACRVYARTRTMLATVNVTIGGGALWTQGCRSADRAGGTQNACTSVGVMEG